MSSGRPDQAHPGHVLAAATVRSTVGHWALTVRTGRHELIVDEPVASGGTDVGPSPMELLVVSLGACTAVTLRRHAEQERWALRGVRVRLAYRVENDRHRIDRDVDLDGDLTEAQCSRLAVLAEDTPVTRLLKGSVEIRTRMSRGA